MADYICPMCDTSVSRTDRACPKCGCPIDFIRGFQTNRKTNTSEIASVQTDDFLELPIIKPVQKTEDSNVPSLVQAEPKSDLSRHKSIVDRRHDIEAPVPAIAGGSEKLKYILEKRKALREATNPVKDTSENIIDVEPTAETIWVQPLQRQNLGKTALCSQCRSIVPTCWGNCPKCGAKLQELVLLKSNIPYVFPEKNDDIEDEGMWQKLIENVHDSKKHKKSEEESYRLSDEYNRDDFESDAFEDNTRDEDDDNY